MCMHVAVRRPHVHYAVKYACVHTATQLGKDRQHRLHVNAKCSSPN